MERTTVAKPKGKTKVVYARYITKNGKRIYPKNGKVFRFEVPADK